MYAYFRDTLCLYIAYLLFGVINVAFDFDSYPSSSSADDAFADDDFLNDVECASVTEDYPSLYDQEVFQEVNIDNAEPEHAKPYAHYENDSLDNKIIQNFPGKIVRKDLTSLMKRGVNVPTFVLEYLLGMYCTTDDDELIEEGIKRIRKILTENYVRPDESEYIKSLIRERGQYTVIDKVSATLDEYGDYYVARFTNLDIEPFLMPADYVQSYSKILSGGIWCIMRIEYIRAEDEEQAFDDIFDQEKIKAKKKSSGKKKRGPEDSPFNILSLQPIQMPNLDLDDFVEHRKNFTTQEWMALLLRSAGYEPDALTEKQKLHFIERMVPLAERNYNLCELGPRGTGKSHIYKEVSPYSILLSGGQTTTANLFGRLSSWHRGSSLGLVSLWDCITFDEVAGMRFKDQNAIQILKDYMASGSFARGHEQLNADASLVLEGNINDSVQNVLKTTHLFDPFPQEFNNDSAFFDRIHCYLPGWEVPKMRSDLLTNKYGLITDCLSEFCKVMRHKDFTHHIDQYFRLNNDFNRRDEIGVRKTFSGLAKLLFPDERMTKEDVRMILEYAIEGRRRVKEQLRIMAGVEFIDVNLGYVDLDDQTQTIVYVAEQPSGTLIPDGACAPGHVFSVGRSSSGEFAFYKFENKAVAGDFKFKHEGIGNSRNVRDSMDAAFECFGDYANSIAHGMKITSKDYLLFFNDLQAKGLSDECSLAEFVGLCSAASGRPVAPGLVIPGVLRMSGSMDEINNLEDIFRVSINAGAKRILLPMSCMSAMQAIPGELVNDISFDFYTAGDPVAVAKKALEL